MLLVRFRLKIKCDEEMAVKLSIYIDASIAGNPIVKDYFIPLYPKTVMELFNGEVKASVSDIPECADIVLCNASSDVVFENVLPIVVDEKISKIYENINSFPLPKVANNENECVQLAMNLMFAVLSRLGIGNFHSRIFISYKRQDTEALALNLFKRLSSESLGFEVFLDTRKLDVGAKFMDDIRLSITETDVFLFLDSPSYLKGVYTKKELYSAMSSCTGIIRISTQKEAYEAEAANIVAAYETVQILNSNVISEAEFRGLIRVICKQRISFLKNKIERINSFCGLHRRERETLWSFKVAGLRICPIWGVPSSQRIERIEKKLADTGRENTVFSILYDHWNIPNSYNKHIQWVVSEKSNIGIKTLQTLYKRSNNDSANAPIVFLSASLPSDECHDYDFVKVYTIIVTLVEEIINNKGKLVFGGHPTITPIIANMMNVQNISSGGKETPCIRLYQSAFFESDKRPIENLDFPEKNITIVSKGGNIEDSLRTMREKMLREEGKFTLGLFIGGKVKNNNGILSCGVWDECELFHANHPNAICVAFANTGTDIDRLRKCDKGSEEIEIIVPKSIKEFVELLSKNAK